jgi:membrane-associated phospholipid phosphatase
VSCLLVALGLTLGAAATSTEKRPGGIDRFAVYEEQELPASLSDAVVYGSMGLSAGVGLTLWTQGEGARPVLAVAGGMATDLAITELGKRSFDRRRPYTYGADTSWVHDNDATKSFPSGHTSTTAAAWFSAAEVLRREGVLDTRGKRVAAYTLASGATVTAGTLRVLAGKHFPTDVMAGAAIGAGMGFLLPGLVYREW